jgi:C4-dicarboxylate-specific signal transduction histidine kinase
VRHALAVSHPAFIAKKLKLTVTLEASKHQVFGDMTRLQQIFWNVFQNAAKFSRSTGSVTVSSHNPTDDRIVIKVTDIGIAIEPEVLFKPANCRTCKKSRGTLFRDSANPVGFALCEVYKGVNLKVAVQQAKSPPTTNGS